MPTFVLSYLVSLNTLSVDICNSLPDQFKGIRTMPFTLFSTGKKTNHVTILCKLHWLPFQACIDHTITMLCYHSLHAQLLQDLVPCNLRCLFNLLVQTSPCHKLEKGKFGRCSFSFSVHLEFSASSLIFDIICHFQLRPQNIPISKIPLCSQQALLLILFFATVQLVCCCMSFKLCRLSMLNFLFTSSTQGNTFNIIFELLCSVCDYIF